VKSVDCFEIILGCEKCGLFPNCSWMGVKSVGCFELF
jgi:hypothetical protein